MSAPALFSGVEDGQTVTLHMKGSTQGLAMRVIYRGEVLDGVHRLDGFGLMDGIQIYAEVEGDEWVLGNGPRATGHEPFGKVPAGMRRLVGVVL